MIVRGAHEVAPGPAAVVRRRRRATQRDLFLVERDDPAQALEEIVSLVATRLPGALRRRPASRTCRSSRPSTRARSASTRSTPACATRSTRTASRVLGGRLRLGDKLMLSGRNLHDLGLMNGTVLRLIAVGDDFLTVTADGVTIDLPDEEAPRLQLAYACCVHKGQGIELPAAVVVAHPAAGACFLRREMLYTAMTRARTATVIVGRRDVVAAAAARADTAGRHSRLVARLAGTQ